MTNPQQIKVLMVCMGNICRSPTAQAVFEKMLVERGLQGRISVDSAGTHAYHMGHAPDARATQTALERGLDMRGQCARQVEPADLEAFDYVLAMDADNLARLQALPGGKARVGLLLDYAAGASVREVPDPYYGGPGGFERVFDLVESGCRGLLSAIEATLGKSG